MSDELMEKQREALQFLLNGVAKRIYPTLLKYFDSQFALEFERRWKATATVRFQENSVQSPELREALWTMCETTVFATLDAMELPEEQAEDLCGIIGAELESLIEEGQVHEEVLGLFGELA